MKHLGLFVLLASLVSGAMAQDLDTVTISDQLNSGKRGNDVGTLTFGGSVPDGSEYADYNGLDLTASITTSVRYINTWGTNAGAESPVLNITAPQTNPDRSAFTLPAITANNRPGATGGGTAVVIGDDGGYNALWLGESNDRNYYIQVDMFCPVATVAAGYEEAGIVARGGRDDVDQNPARMDYSYNPYLDGAYGLYYHYQSATLKAVVTGAAGAGETIQVGSVTGVTQGWHTLRIECKDSTIKYFFDGIQVGTDLTDTSVLSGRPAIYYYEENNVDDDKERQGVFDNLKAGPTSTSDVGDWNLY